MKKTIHKINNIDIILLNTNKFKNSYFNFVFSGKYDEKNIAKRNVLLDMLIDSSQKYNSNKLLNKTLNDLYATDIISSYSKQYELSQTNFIVNCINERYIKEDEFYKQIVELSYEILFNPRVQDGLFNEEVFLESKDNLRNKIISVYDSKSSYALKRLLENMAPNEVISKTSLGTLEELELITLEDIYDEYKRLLKEKMIIYIVGEFEEEKILSYFNNSFVSSSSIEGSYLCPYDFSLEKKLIIEKQDINQSRLCIGYRINEKFDASNYFVASIFNYIFGGSYSSVLMEKIRRENSYAYSVYSSTNLQNKLMYINMGIDKVNYKKIIKLIDDELLKFTKGFISDDLFNTAKEMILSEVTNMNDSLGSIVSAVKFRDLYGFSLEEDKNITIIKDVKIKDIIEFSKKIVLNTIFLLEGK